MKAKLTIKNEESKNTIIFDDIKDKKVFNCACADDEYSVDLRECFSFILKAKDHTTKVKIRKIGESSIEIVDNNGSISLPIDVVAIKENNGIIYLVYKIDGKENSIELEFI